MPTSSHHNTTPTIKFEHVNWIAMEALPYDQTQSCRLHEPKYRTNTTDPMTGQKILGIVNAPSLVEGNLTIFFESEDSRKAYQDIPINHPNQHLPYPASDDDDRGG